MYSYTLGTIRALERAIGETMEFADRLASLATKVRNQAKAIGTEEATKNAFVMPFISTILGYDV
ncbi:MAG TPA: hypothetical protein VNT50_12640, partial [Microbacterium sp.]|nr:hypothetical protein [Microbacterium sp.]